MPRHRVRTDLCCVPDLDGFGRRQACCRSAQDLRSQSDPELGHRIFATRQQECGSRCHFDCCISSWLQAKIPAYVNGIKAWAIGSDDGRLCRRTIGLPRHALADHICQVCLQVSY